MFASFVTYVLFVYRVIRRISSDWNADRICASCSAWLSAAVVGVSAVHLVWVVSRLFSLNQQNFKSSYKQEETMALLRNSAIFLISTLNLVLLLSYASVYGEYNFWSARMMFCSLYTVSRGPWERICYAIMRAIIRPWGTRTLTLPYQVTLTLWARTENSSWGRIITRECNPGPFVHSRDFEIELA